MEMERINDDTIKVVILPEDLEARGVEFIDLIGDHKRIEKFFYSILEEFDMEDQFLDSESVTFHVIPSERGLELYISRNGSHHVEEVLENEIVKRLMKHRAERIMNKAKQQKQESNEINETNEMTEAERLLFEAIEAEGKEDEGLPEIICFNQLEDIILMARSMSKIPVANSLYFMNGRYFLVLTEVLGELSEEDAYAFYLQLVEYGESHATTESILAEHGQLLYADQALTLLKKL